MKHLVLVVGIYYPQPSPTGKCAKDYVSLLKDKYNVDVIYIQSGLEKIYGRNVGNETLYGLSNWRLWLETWFLERSKKTANKFLNNILLLGVLIMKVIGRLQSMVLFPNNLRWFYKEAYKTLCRIHKENPIDVVFTVNSPFSAHLAGDLFKKKYPNVKWVTYTVDPFYVSHKIGRVWNWNRNKAFLAEACFLKSADTNFLSEEVYENSKELYEEIGYKTFSLPYLMPTIERWSDNKIFDSSKINLVYAGRFYKDIRNPEFLLKTILLTQNKDIVLHLYSASDCEDVINEYVEKSAGKIIRHPLVTHQEIQKVLLSADILVSVGNSVPEFKPSKIFEYIVTGRPIINFYQNGLIDNVLARHPLVLQVDMQKSLLANSEFEEFCYAVKGRIIPQSNLESIYEKYSEQSIKKILSLRLGM